MTKPANFPGRKLKRQIEASKPRYEEFTSEELKRIEAARLIRTKKHR